MTLRLFPRRAVALGGFFLATAAAWAQSAPTPEATAGDLYAALQRAMKSGPSLGFEGRRRLLDPELRRDLNLPLMARLVVGPVWREMSAGDRTRITEAFSDYSIAVYASRFKDYSGEQFLVDPGTKTLDNGQVIVHTRLIPKGGDPVQLDYLMRRAAAGWQIIDVFLSGTISELATRRSEYSAVLRESGADGLVGLLRRKTAELRG